MVWTVVPGDRVRVVRDPGKTYDSRLPRAFSGTVVQVTPRLLVVDAGPYRAAVAAWEVIAGYAEVVREQGAATPGEGDCTRPPAPPGKGALRRPCGPPLPSGRGPGEVWPRGGRKGVNRCGYSRTRYRRPWGSAPRTRWTTATRAASGSTTRAGGVMFLIAALLAAALLAPQKVEAPAPAPAAVPAARVARAPDQAPARVLVMRATGYSVSAEEGTADGITATGTRAGPGVAAVDPRVIPLGTRLHVAGYGPAVAADTGGAIRGGRIDLCFASRGEALRWGVRTVRVVVYQCD